MSKNELPYKVGDAVTCTLSKMQGLIGMVTDIEETDGGYTVEVNFPSWGLFVHDSSYFVPFEVKTLEESLPGATKIIDDYFFEMF